MKPSKIKKIMKGTCFKSIAYCCGLDNPCPIRDHVLKELGLNKKDFVKLKKQFDENLFKRLEN